MYGPEEEYRSQESEFRITTRNPLSWLLLLDSEFWILEPAACGG